ncbi:rhodanese-like domain-containing protein [Paenibacillus methanolicus]|uniref:Rhodanese-related sulfurtransferase n=1 Tax=Paenibacillus methanolicus TaxID=582686 RepID=A0A5S5BS75_9BACL|nr:rhodanese-like domain-containing protein [Paenibacillus methanolicus]TYP70041.1 rhodanese-related sulfurtransferase [Paenibacillus methanolicus]
MTFNLNTIIDIAIAALVLWLLYLQFGPVRGLRTLPAREFNRALAEAPKEALLLDVREAGEFRRGAIPKAVNIPLSALGRRLGEIPKDRSVYLYCQSGVRSKRAARLLKRKGYSRIAHLKGGISAWNGEQAR